MERREFLAASAAGAVTLGTEGLPLARMEPVGSGPRATRKILIAGGGFGAPFIRYMAQLTGKPRPRLCYLPTASADSQSGTLSWYRTCAALDVVPFD
ncbi:MAG: twin-arginine translocation signal domain-containing protein, partial [Gemmatimonadetes bacterium]|nr:twin-arginine translocation signal domain-containing protein [Gemmatimonadota bacterium]